MEEQPQITQAPQPSKKFKLSFLSNGAVVSCLIGAPDTGQIVNQLMNSTKLLNETIGIKTISGQVFVIRAEQIDGFWTEEVK